MGEVIDAGELGNIKNKTVVGKLAEFISVESFGFERTPKHLKTV